MYIFWICFIQLSAACFFLVAVTFCNNNWNRAQSSKLITFPAPAGTDYTVFMLLNIANQTVAREKYLPDLFNAGPVNILPFSDLKLLSLIYSPFFFWPNNIWLFALYLFIYPLPSSLVTWFRMGVFYTFNYCMTI